MSNGSKKISKDEVYALSKKILSRHDGHIRTTNLPDLERFLIICKENSKSKLKNEVDVPLTVVTRRLSFHHWTFPWNPQTSRKWLMKCWTSNGSWYAPLKASEIVMDSIIAQKIQLPGTSRTGQVVGSAANGMLRVRLVDNESIHLPATLFNVTRDRVFECMNISSYSDRGRCLDQFDRIVKYYTSVENREKAKSILESGSMFAERELNEHVFRWWKLVNKHTGPIQLYEPAEEPESNNERLSKCIVRGKLGHGAYSQVFWGEFEGQIMAFKIFRRRPITTIKNEFEILKRLREVKIPHAVRMFDDKLRMEAVSGTPVISTELCGFSLKSLVTSLWTSSRSKSRVHDMMIVTKQILTCLSACHEMGIVHRDIKLENIMLISCEPIDIRIIDWGLGREFNVVKKCKRNDGSSSSSSSGKNWGCAGTRYWRAPEMLLLDLTSSSSLSLNKCDHSLYTAVDVWSVGVVIAYMLTGGEHVFIPTAMSSSRSKLKELCDVIRVCGTKTLPAEYKVQLLERLTEFKEGQESTLLPTLMKKCSPHSRYLVGMVSKMLVYDPKARVTMKALLSSIGNGDLSTFKGGGGMVNNVTQRGICGNTF